MMFFYNFYKNIFGSLDLPFYLCIVFRKIHMSSLFY